MLYSFFWVIAWHLNFMYQRFGTLSVPSFCFTPSLKMEQAERSETSAHKIQTLQNHPKERITTRTTLLKNSSGNVGIKLLNKLPETIKKLEKTLEFKRRPKHFLLQHIFYSVDECRSL
jgi:hypothetical protein